MSVIESTQFYVKEILIQSKGGPVPIKDMVEEINFYDNLFMSVSSGELLITDTAKLLERLSLINDPIQFHISKTPKDNFGIFKKVFRIYDITNRQNKNNSSETYLIHFVEDEFIFSRQRKISFGYDGTYSGAVDKIMKDGVLGLGLTNDRINLIEQSDGIRDITIPNLSPLDAIEWCAKRALSSRQIPEFVFFSNMAGFNFVSLSTLMQQDSILDITFAPKNLSGVSDFLEMGRARGFQVISQADSVSRMKSGVDAGAFIGFDLLTRSIKRTEIDGKKVYDAMAHANPNEIFSEIINKDNRSIKENFDANQILSFFNNKDQSNIEYIKTKDPTSISKNETVDLFLQQRKAIITRLMEKRIRIAMPGNFQLSSGYIVEVLSPGFGAAASIEDQSSNFDRSLSGRYLIVGVRHILSGSRHVSVIEVATDSTIDPRKAKTTQNQQTALAGYDGNVDVG